MPRPKKQRKKPLPLPRFPSAAAEREFWATHDVVDYFDWSKAAFVTFPNLKPSTTTISIRLPESMLQDLKVLANEQDVPYQSLMKVFLAEQLATERNKK